MTAAPTPSTKQAIVPPTPWSSDGRDADGRIRVVSLHGPDARTEEGAEALTRALDDASVSAVWVDLAGPTAAAVESMAGRLGLHPLIAEDIVEGNQRAKIEVTDDLVHLVIFALGYEEDLELAEIDIVLGERFLLTVHPARWDPHRIRRVQESLPALLTRGPDHLLWAIVDAIVDDYFPLLDRVGDAIDELEDRVIADPRPATLDRLFRLKRELLAIRRAVNPVRDIFNQLTNRDLALIDAEEILYFRDVYDHLIRLTDELDTYRELVSGTLDVYLSTINNNLSVVMKRLTGVTVILAGIGAVAGIFGMSEAGAAFQGAESLGFWLVTGVAVVLAVAAALVLRRIGWI